MQGHIYVEAFKEAHMKEAVKSLRMFYHSKPAKLVPLKEMVDAITVHRSVKAVIGAHARVHGRADACWEVHLQV